MRNYMVSRQ